MVSVVAVADGGEMVQMVVDCWDYGDCGEVRFLDPNSSTSLQIKRVLSRGRPIGTCGTIAPVMMLGMTSYRRRRCEHGVRLVRNDVGQLAL